MRSKKGLKKRLIVNADDFGLDPAINCGIKESFKNGIVTSVSLITCGRAFDEAMEFVKGNNNIGAGIHLTLNEESPILPKDKIKSLIEEDRNCFLGLPAFMIKFLTGRIVWNEVSMEYEAQIQRFIDAGLKPTHIDSHKHLHMLPGMLEVVLELAKKYGIYKIRFSRSSMAEILMADRFTRALSVLGLSGLANIQLQKIRKSNIKMPEYSYGLIESGRIDKKQLMSILKRIPAGTYELFCHPGYATSDLLRQYKWNYNWLNELLGLVDPDVKAAIMDLNIELIRYDEI